MTTFYVFKWDRYYPSGGWNDLERMFETFAEVEAYHEQQPLEWAQTRQVVGVGGIVQEWHGEGY